MYTKTNERISDVYKNADISTVFYLMIFTVAVVITV